MTEKRLVLPKIELKFKIGTLGYSILMNIMIMLFMILFFYARYDCEIDIAMQSMLYGVSDSGKPCAYLIFSNIVLGKILMILMGIAPKIAWYTVFHYVMILVSLIVISYIIISRNDNSVGHMIAMIVAVFIGYECYIMPVYIKTAAVLTAASFMLWWYLYQAKEKPFKKTTILAVEFLGILGSLVSWKIFLGTSFMMIVVLFFCFYKKHGQQLLRHQNGFLWSRGICKIIFRTAAPIQVTTGILPSLFLITFFWIIYFYVGTIIICGWKTSKQYSSLICPVQFASGI